MNHQLKKRLIKVALALMLTPYAALLGGAPSLQEQSVAAALTLNIARYSKWPANIQTTMQQGIKLCVVGDNLVQEAFANLDQKPVGDKSLSVINLSRLRNFETCHLLFIDEVKQNILLQVFNEIGQLPVLTIGKGVEFAEEGGMVGLENVNGKLTLNINLTVVRKANISIDARLLSLAKTIGQ